MQVAHELRWQGRAKFHAVSGTRMCKCDARGAQEVAFERRQKFAANPFLPPRAGQRVAHDRETERGKKYAVLVGAPGVQVGFDREELLEPQTQASVGARFAAVGPARGHALTALHV